MFLRVLAVNDAAFYTKNTIFSVVSHTRDKRFRRKKTRKPAPNMLDGVFSQTLGRKRNFIGQDTGYERCMMSYCP